ncbi:MAG: D-alanyl-D-alanine dipeptidase [Alphaproteobacteria bacterium GM202ARS2]|nr:D-alanyl-D-alanine dipeptidase [Alphaproteobacteria bacterium GM202ARS2]
MTDSSLILIAPPAYDIDIQLAYATPDNVTRAVIYDPNKAQAYLHKDAAARLQTAIALAAQQGLRLRLFDAFRPQKAQQILWRHHPDERFVAHPSKGSPHSRGVAVDITLLDKQNKPLDMGTPFDDFSPRSYHGASSLAPRAQANRYLLLGIMMSAGWDLFINEWWHYQLFNSTTYPLIDDNSPASTTMLPRPST